LVDLLKKEGVEASAWHCQGFDLRQLCLDSSRLKSMRTTGLLRVLRDTATEIARLQALQMRTIADLDERHQGSAEVAVEVASALQLSLDHARKTVEDAKALATRLPMTLTMMETGALDRNRASKVCAATAWLSDDDARSADIALQHRLRGKDAGQVRRAAAYAARKVDPGGAARRMRKAGEARRVMITYHRAGTASLVIGNGSVEKVNAAYGRLDRAARELTCEDQARSLDQSRVDVALALLADVGEFNL
jgi:hypothetical protein